MPTKERLKVPETGQSSQFANKLMLTVFVIVIALPMPLQIVFERKGKVVDSDKHIQALDIYRYSKEKTLPEHIGGC